MYIISCSILRVNLVADHYYRYVFNTEFILHFHFNWRDACKACGKYMQAAGVENNLKWNVDLRYQLEIHLAIAEKI